MRLLELQKRKTKIKPEPVVYDPMEAARERLESLKDMGTRLEPNGTIQLFIPRKMDVPRTKKEIRDYIYKNKTKYAFDDEGNLKPEYQKMIDMGESIIREAAPIIPTGNNPQLGGNKPIGAVLWTSTAIKLENGKYTSDWNKFVQREGLGDRGFGNQGKIGYLYKVKPNTAVLELNTNNEAKQIYNIFNELGRGNTKLYDPEEWKKPYASEDLLMKYDFPWPEIAKHFDCVHHYNYSSSYYDSFANFFYGYDCESTIWFKPERLELLGQVPIWSIKDIENQEE